MAVNGFTVGPAGVPDEISWEFERLALALRSRGFDHYSADAILHHIRWHEHFDKGNKDFKCNNNWTAPLARWAMLRNQVALAGFFELRERRNRPVIGDDAEPPTYGEHRQ